MTVFIIRLYANEWVIVKDGSVSPQIQEVIDKYKQIDGVNIKEVQLVENKGLGIALSVDVRECSYELIARMDTDDIAAEQVRVAVKGV